MKCFHSKIFYFFRNKKEINPCFIYLYVEDLGIAKKKKSWQKVVALCSNWHLDSRAKQKIQLIGRYCPNFFAHL